MQIGTNNLGCKNLKERKNVIFSVNFQLMKPVLQKLKKLNITDRFLKDALDPSILLTF